MNSPETDTGGFSRGSHMLRVTRTSVNVWPPSFERDRYVSMKKLFGSLRRSKYMTLTWPFGVTAIHGWNWSRRFSFESWLTRTGPLYVLPPSVDLNSTMSVPGPGFSSASVSGRPSWFLTRSSNDTPGDTGAPSPWAEAAT